MRQGSTETPVFVLGCYRSGKTTLLNTIEDSPDCAIFHETNPRAYRNWRIKSPGTIRALVRKSAKKVIVFELVNDLQHADNFLRMFPEARAVWLYRHYRDVVCEALQSWGSLWREFVKGTASRSLRYWFQQRALLERMSIDTRARLAACCRTELSPADGAALLWYARNVIYFDLELQHDPRVLMVQFEGLLSQSERQLRRVLDFIGCACHGALPGYALTAHTRQPLVLRPDVEAMCTDLLKQLDYCYLRQLNIGGTDSPEPTARREHNRDVSLPLLEPTT